MTTKDELAQSLGAVAQTIARIEQDSIDRDSELATAGGEVLDLVSDLAKVVTRLDQRVAALEQGTPAPGPGPAPAPEPPAPEPPPPVHIPTPRRPFSLDSQWNLPIAPGARRELDDASRRLREWSHRGRGINIGRNDYTVGLWQAETSDPIVEVEIRSPDSSSPGKVGKVRLHMPRDARPSPGTDGHCTIIDPSRRILHEFWWMQTGMRRAGSYVPAPIDSTGFGFGNGFGESGWTIPGMLGWGSCRAYGGSSTAGLILDGELAGGIEHMLMIAAPDAEMTSPWVYPATRDDGGRHYGPGGAVPMGTIFTLPQDFDVRGRGYSTQITNVGLAMHGWGLHVGDKAGRNWQMYMRLGYAQELESARGWRDELGDLFRHAVTLKGNTPETPKGWRL